MFAEGGAAEDDAEDVADAEEEAGHGVLLFVGDDVEDEDDAEDECRQGSLLFGFILLMKIMMMMMMTMMMMTMMLMMMMIIVMMLMMMWTLPWSVLTRMLRKIFDSVLND